MSSDDSISSLLDQIKNQTLTTSEWTNKISTLSSEDVSTVVQLIIKLIRQDTTYYNNILIALIHFDPNEDRITELLEFIFSSVDTKVLEEDWFSFLCTDFLHWTDSADLIENFFFFLNQLYQKQPFQYNSKFIQSLHLLPSPITQFNLMIFIAEHRLHLIENNEILQLFFSVPESLKLNFIPILFTFSEKDFIIISKEILFSKKLTKEPYVILRILFQLKYYLGQIFNTYEDFKQFIMDLQDQKILELLFAEYTKSESITEPWIQKLLLEILKKNNTLSTFIIESSGEYIADWQEQFRKEFLQLILSTNNNLKAKLASILSPIWFDEDIILKLLEIDNERVRETLFESVILIYQLLSPELQEKFFTLFKGDHKNQKFYGLLLAYNFQRPAFFKEVQQHLEDLTNPAHEKLLAGILVGLGMRWNDIEKDFQTYLKNKIKSMSVSQQQELRKGLELIYGSLDLETINIVTNLQSYEYQISPNDISLD